MKEYLSETTTSDKNKKSCYQQFERVALLVHIDCGKHSLLGTQLYYPSVTLVIPFQNPPLFAQPFRRRYSLIKVKLSDVQGRLKVITHIYSDTIQLYREKLI